MNLHWRNMPRDSTNRKVLNCGSLGSTGPNNYHVQWVIYTEFTGGVFVTSLNPNGEAHLAPAKHAAVPEGLVEHGKQELQEYQLVHWPPSWLLPVRQDKRVRTGSEYQDYFSRFCHDVKARGVVQPIIAVRNGDAGETVDGETRRLAALLSGQATVPVLLFENELSESELILAQLQANEMRREFTDLERAEIYARLMHVNNWSQSQLALHIRVKPAQVSKVMAVSSKLPEDLRAMIGEGDGKIPPSSAYLLSRLPTAESMRDLAGKISQGHLKRDELAAEVARRLGKQSCKKEKPIKVTLHGMTLVITEADPEKLSSLLALVDGAIKKLQKHGLPLASLPSLLKT